MSPGTVAAALQHPVTRRSFVKWSAAAGGAAAAVGGAVHYGLLPLSPAAAADTPAPEGAGTRQVWSSCNVNCGSRCPLRLTVTDGTITRVDPDATGDDELASRQIRACVRGRSIRQRVYNADRIKYPMKRVGARGEGKFEQISWDQALDEIADRLKATIEQYGNEAVYDHYASGATGSNISTRCFGRFINLIGGSLGYYGTYSTAQINFATPFTYGVQRAPNNTFEDTVHSKLVVLWGNNPHETRMSGGGELFTSLKAKQAGGAKVVVIDPRASDSEVSLADEWVPIRPGTDAALVAAMAHVMISEDLHDQEFLDRYCLGFDEAHMPEGSPAGRSYRSYVMGEGPDREAKTPEWAEAITGVPATTITRLAREMALTKPCAIIQGWGPQRAQNGEQTVRAIYLMAAMTGNIGISGGGLGEREGSYSLPVAKFPTGTNPVKTKISCFLWTDAIERGTEMTRLRDGVQGKDKLDVPIKFMWNYAGNTIINQHSDAGRTAALLRDDTLLETLVVVENHMTPSARFADYLLPDTTNFEQPDLIPSGYAGELGYMILAEQAVEPMFECRTAYETVSGLAERFGVLDAFTEGRTQEEWVRELVAQTQEELPDAPGFDELQDLGVWRQTNPDGFIIGLKDFVEDPVANPLETPSGLIEIYSPRLQEIADTWELPEGDRITALPEYVAGLESPADPLAATYPLQMIGHHFKGRTHSTYANVAWLREAHPQQVWINTRDAAERGIENGDTVAVYNDRGRIVLGARVTLRIAPGVVSVPQGAWYTPDADGVDQGGCTNTLTTWHPSPLAKGNPQHTNLVQIERA